MKYNTAIGVGVNNSLLMLSSNCNNKILSINEMFDMSDAQHDQKPIANLLGSARLFRHFAFLEPGGTATCYTYFSFISILL